MNPTPWGHSPFWDGLHSVYGMCLSLNKFAFSLLRLVLEFFPDWSQGPSLVRACPRDSPETLWEHIHGLISYRATMQKTAACCLAEKTHPTYLRCRLLAVGLLLFLGKPLPFALAENSRAFFAYLVRSWSLWSLCACLVSIFYFILPKQFKLLPKHID